MRDEDAKELEERDREMALLFAAGSAGSKP